MTAWVPIRRSLGIYQIGDRVPWCEGCYGKVIANVHGMLVIMTDDGYQRTTNEDYTLKVEDALQKRGIVWK